MGRSWQHWVLVGEGWGLMREGGHGVWNVDGQGRDVGLHKLHLGPGSLLLLRLLTGRGSERDPEICAREPGGAHARPLSGGALRLWNTGVRQRGKHPFSLGQCR